MTNIVRGVSNDTISTKDKQVDRFEPVLRMSVGVNLKENNGIHPDGLRYSKLGGYNLLLIWVVVQ
jgi:hypothetical protein